MKKKKEQAGHSMSFINFYELLQISPNAEQETVQRVFRMLAARFHPDNPRTGDRDKFILLNQAHTILSHPESRAKYDMELQSHRAEPLALFTAPEFVQGIDGETHRRMGILSLLYNNRRSNPDQAGMSLLELESMMSMPREHLLFTIWYLKEKDWIRQAENSDLVISAEGVDHVEKNLGSHQLLYNLLKAAENGAVPPESAVGKQASGEAS
jgi:curved DNA-binding protein CbpA